MPLLSTLGAGKWGGVQTGYVSGKYYPICAVKIINDTNNLLPAQTETRMRNALSLLAGNSGALSSLTQLISFCDADGYAANPDFIDLTVSGYRLRYYSSSSVSYEASFDTGVHNFYNDIADAPTNVFNTKVHSSVTPITNVILNGAAATASSVFINASTSPTRNGTNDWASDNGDYLFMGVLGNTSSYASGSDDLDRVGAISGIAFGISDSDGAPASSQSPRLGISRRNENYASLVTVAGYYPTVTHSGSTVSGYIVIEGKIA